jgi:hypothetical protein
MAEKRMFTQKIVDSDAFLDMPLSTQALYFHLNMHADDDGFVNNPKKIQRVIGASLDDLKLLIAKRFILVFENGVIVIKHWRMHNLLRKDRYNPTQYQDQMERLELKDNGAYTEKLPEPLEIKESESVATRWQPDDNQMAHRIGKDRIGKDRIGEVRGEESVETATCQQVVDLFHSICVSYPAVKTLSESRKKAIRARLRVYSLEDFKSLFEKAEASSFLKGSNDRNWSATFDWLLKESNMVKVLEGNYDNKPRQAESAKPITGNKFNNFHQRQYDMGSLEQMLLENQSAGG